MDELVENSYNNSKPPNITNCYEISSKSFITHVYIIFIILGLIALLVILIFTINKFMVKRHYFIAEPSVKPENASIQTYTSQTEQDIILQPINPPASAPTQPIVIVESCQVPEDEYFDFPAPSSKSNPYGYVPMTPPPVSSPPSTPPYYVNMFPRQESAPSTTESVPIGEEHSSSGYVPMASKIDGTAKISKILTCPLPPTPTDQACFKIQNS